MTPVGAILACLARARALRFLLLVVGGWCGLRLVMLAPVPPEYTAPPSAPWPAVLPWPAPVPGGARDRGDGMAVRVPQLGVVARPAALGAQPGARLSPAPPLGGLFAGPGRHELRQQLLLRMLPHAFAASASGFSIASGGANRLAMAVAAPQPAFAPLAPPGLATGSGGTFASGGERWSAAAWSVWLSGGSAPASGLQPLPALGQSQSGIRLSRHFGAGGAQAYVRASAAPGRPASAEVALGAAVRPVAGVPLAIHAERRAALSGGGSSTALFAAGGVNGAALGRAAGRQVVVDGYGQAGAVLADGGGTAGFADGALAVAVPLADRDDAGVRGQPHSAAAGRSFTIGSLITGAVQPGAARLTVGPQVEMRWQGGQRSGRVALDWRSRIAGNAGPAGAVAITLAADF